MLEARAHAREAGCYNNGTTIDIVIWIHEWSGDNTKPYVVSIEPPNMEENVRLYSSLPFERSQDLFGEELYILLSHRERVHNIEDILGYP